MNRFIIQSSYEVFAHKTDTETERDIGRVSLIYSLHLE
jgi:hypothetical protein